MNSHNPQLYTIHTLLRLLVCTTTMALGQTITTAPDPATPTLLRPSSGEIVPINQLYTIQWTPPPPGPLAIELFGYNTDHLREVSGLLPDYQGCDGWVINTRCDKFNITLPEGATSYVWDLIPKDEWFDFSYKYVILTMGVYISTLEYGELPSTDAAWYVSSPFSMVEPEEPSTTTTTMTTTRTTTTMMNTLRPTVTSTTEEASTSTPISTSEIETETGSPTTSIHNSPIGSEVPSDTSTSSASGNNKVWYLWMALTLGCVTSLLSFLS